MTDHTLTDRWLRRLKNNPVVAALIVIGISVAAILSFWDHLPTGLRDWVGDMFHSRPESTQTQPSMGWVFAGYADKNNELRWASPARIRLVHASGAGDHPHMFRAGDVVQPLQPVPQVIADYRTAGTLHQMDAPWTITEVIRKSEDWTGRTYPAGKDLEVLDVSVSQLPDADWAVWLRVAPSEQSD